MPVIRITSLPFEHEAEIPAAIQKISATLASLFDIDEQHISISWHYLSPGHYCCGGEVADLQSADTHPLAVDILIPDFNPADVIEEILLAVAEVLAKSVNVSHDNIFIHLRTARSGTIFDSGMIAEWPAATKGEPMT
ncbi:MAG: hypothetical protein GWN87_28475, partial [Desulfuromonadales bacterium]|nr:hypothetical protein [Desulfuromonadales bacterium]